MLSLDGIRVTIRGFIILRGITLEVPASGLVGLVGRNGAGKTTTLKTVMGIMPVAAGDIRLGGVDLVPIPGHQRAHLGIGYMPEDRRLIGQLTVQDNVLMPVWAGRLTKGAERLEYIYELMPELPPLAGRRASTLSGGQQKMVALARAIMSGSRLLLLDEPFEGLSPALGDRLGARIRRLKQDGLAVLIAESDLKRLSFVDRIYTIERGEIVKDV